MVINPTVTRLYYAALSVKLCVMVTSPLLPHLGSVSACVSNRKLLPSTKITHSALYP